MMHHWPTLRVLRMLRTRRRALARGVLWRLVGFLAPDLHWDVPMRHHVVSWFAIHVLRPDSTPHSAPDSTPMPLRSVGTPRQTVLSQAVLRQRFSAVKAPDQHLLIAYTPLFISVSNIQ